MIKPVRIYKSIDMINEPLTPFKPLFIEKPSYPKEIFEKQFSSLNEEKKTVLKKFANLEETYKLVYDFFDLKILSALTVQKMKTLFSLASMKDITSTLRFTPSELFEFAKLAEKDYSFLKAAARQKDKNGVFNFSYQNLIQLSKFSSEERKKAAILLDFGLSAEDLTAVCKDSSADALALRKRLETLKRLYSNNIFNMSVKRFGTDYVISLCTEKEHKVHRYVFDNNFNLNKKYKSDVDFESGLFKKQGFFKYLNPFSKPETFASDTGRNSFKVSYEEHLNALDSIQENIDILKERHKEVYRKNFCVMNSGEGQLVKNDFKLPENLIKDLWKKGALSQEDLIQIFTENAGLISNEDFKWFASRRIKLTPYDTEKCLDIRQKNAMSQEPGIFSDYYQKIKTEVLKNTLEQLKNIKAERKMIIVDGLPGAGKTTLIKKLLKKDSSSYFTPDSDEIKKFFSEIYNNGEGAPLVHKASGAILKKEILPIVLQQGKNLIFQTSGSSESVHRILSAAKDHGYSVNFIHAQVPKDISIERAIARFEKEGRYIDPYDVLAIFNKNTKEKKYIARIFSYDDRLENTYIYKENKFFPVKDGNIQ